MKIYDYMGRKNICGAKVREQRKKRNLSQSELATQMQLEGVIIERDSVSRIESGTRFVPDYKLMVIAKVLHVSVDQLLGI